MAEDAPRRTPPDAAEAPVTFVGFLVSLGRTAAVHFGDLPDPVSGAPRAPDLQAAGRVIDMLRMLEEKTRGNLTPDERRLLEGMIDDLRVRHAQAAEGRGGTGFARPGRS
jgi:hypothetical protein